MKHRLKVCIEIVEVLNLLRLCEVAHKSRFEVGKTFSSTIGNHQIQLKYYRCPCYSFGSDNRFDDFLLSDGTGKSEF